MPLIEFPNGSYINSQEEIRQNCLKGLHSILVENHMANGRPMKGNVIPKEEYWCQCCRELFIISEDITIPEFMNQD